MPGQPGTETRQRTENVRVRLTPEEHAEIVRKAQACNCSLSAFMRNSALRRKLFSKADTAAMADLNRLGGLLKWWLTDGVGKDGERQHRGKATGKHVDDINRLLDEISKTILRVSP